MSITLITNYLKWLFQKEKQSCYQMFFFITGVVDKKTEEGMTILI